MSDEDRLGKEGTGVAKDAASVPAVIRPDRMILRREIVAPIATLLLDPNPDARVEPGIAIPLAQWLDRKQKAEDLHGVGVIVQGPDDIAPLQPHLDAVPFIALRYPVFSDGRSYSHAYRLRKTWKYAGPLIAFGDVLRDQLLYMSRCGIDGFYLRQDQNLEACLAAFQLYSAYYQYNDIR